MPVILPNVQRTGIFSTQYNISSFGNSGSADPNYTYRMIVPSITRGGSKVRVTFQGDGGLAVQFLHMAIGVRSGSSADCIATPAELKVGGASGLLMSSGGVTVSDVTDFNTARGQDLLVIFDFAGANANKTYSITATGGSYGYRKAAAQSWNTATLSSPDDLVTPGLTAVCVSKVEIFGN